MNIFRISTQELISCVGKLSFVHSGKGNGSGAFLLQERAKIKFSLPRRMSSHNVILTICNETKNKELFSFTLQPHSFNTEYDNYVVHLNTKKLGVGLYFAIIKVETMLGEIYATNNGAQLVFSETIPEKMIQISVSDFKYYKPENKYGGIIYQIFVDRFNRTENSNIADGAVFVEDWHSDIPEIPQYPGAFIKNNYFYGGNLQGITEKLDYISSLGVNIIYLSPIFKAYSNHKYDTGNYMEVDEGFGGEEALVTLIQEAKKYGIGIILDGVFNHTGANSLYFNKFGTYNSIGAYQSKESPYFDWYDFQNHPNKYTSWWGIDILPRINPDKKSCREYFTGKSGVIEKYAKLGIDGFRLDVVDELSDDFVESIKETLDKQNQNSVIFGEVWEDASNKIAYGRRKKYYLGKELDGVMNYPARNAIIDFVKNKSTEGMRYFFETILNNAPKRIRDLQMNLLGTHDTERILTVLGGVESKGKTNLELLHLRMSDSEKNNAISSLKMAYTILATIPGLPTIYYGDEAGVEGYSDPFNRRTYPWRYENSEILDFYKKTSSIRRKNEVYKEGECKLLLLDRERLIFARFNKDKVLLTVVNNSDSPFIMRFSKTARALFSDVLLRRISILPKTSEIIDITGMKGFKIYN